MNFHESLHHLETASQIMMAPPNLVTNQNRQEAEQILRNFRKTRSDSASLDLCKYIIEHSNDELVLFEAAQGMRDTLILNWGTLGNRPDILALPRTLLQILLHSTKYSQSVQRALGSVIALIVKHLALGNVAGDTPRTQIVQTLLQGFATSTGHSMSVCITLLEAMISEHAYLVNTTDHSIPYDQHFASKKNFENVELLKIFEGTLHYLANYDPTTGNEKELQRILSLTEKIFYWNFTKTNLPRRITAVIEMDSTPPFKPPPTWQALVTNPAFIQVIFDTHSKVRTKPDLSVHTFNFLTQLFSMQGPLISSKDGRVLLLSKILPRFTELLQLSNLGDYEVLGLSEVVRKIMLFHRTSTLCALEPNLFHNFLRIVGQFTVKVLRGAVLEESSEYVDDRKFRESCTKVLEAWMNILTDADELPKELLIPIATEVFNTYLYGHLSPPIGFRPLLIETEDIDDEIEEGDQKEFRDQLQALGLFSRFVVSHSVPLLTGVLEERLGVYRTELQRLIGAGSGNRDSLIPIYEDLHWIILLIGHTLCYDGNGEVNLIPAEIIQYSIQSASNIGHTVHVLQNCFLLQPSPTTGRPDPVVKLISTVLMLSELERQLIGSGNAALVSPEVTGNVLWCMERWAKVYFCYNSGHYDAVSETFKETWSHESQIGIAIQAALFVRIRQDLLKFTSEEGTLKESLRLLHALVNTERKARLALNNQEIIPLVQLLNSIGVGPNEYKMPADLYRGFITSMIVVGNGSSTDEREQFWSQIFGPLFARFQNFISMDPKHKYQEGPMQEINLLLSAFIGIAAASDSRVACRLFEKISPILAHLPGILDVYHNYLAIIELCLKFLTEVGRKMLSYLPRNDSVKVYHASMLAVKSYAHHAGGRRVVESTAEEDAYNDLVLLMDMLLSLLTKDFLDLSGESLSDEPGAEVQHVTASEIALQGLQIILPLMNVDLLGYPLLSSKYYKLIAFLSELHAEKLVNSWMIDSISESIRIGLQNSSSGNFNLCCEFITCVVNNICRNNLQSCRAAQFLKPFLKELLEMILLQEIGKDSVASIASAVFSLISAFREAYEELITHIISTIKTQEKQELLRKYFMDLTGDLNMSAGGDRRSRTVFRDRLDGFIQAAKVCFE